MAEPKPLKCVVACSNAGGPSDFCYVVVVCTREQYDEGLHAETAKAHAADMGYGGPMVVFDENDAPDWLLASNNWHGIEPVTCEETP